MVDEKNKQNQDKQNQKKDTDWQDCVFKVFFCANVIIRRRRICRWWVMAVRGAASHKPSSNNGKGRSPLTMAQRVFLVLVIKLRTKTTGFIR